MKDITISNIEIRNFRSIAKLNLSPKKVSILVGQNDCGKSNILRALNLFFNNETDPGCLLDFQTDFHIHGYRQQKANEIFIEVELKLPENYRETNGDFLIWRKTWRKESKTPKEDTYSGKRIIKGVRGAKTAEIFDIPAKSNLHATLKQINFRYVPATKTTDYFDSLRGEIYHTISSIAKKSFHRSSKKFETDISKHIIDLTSDLATSLGFESRLALPNDLSPIFEKLDFISKENISLKNRGDGIKARHIPHILYFMAQKQKELSRRGGPRFTTIWGYEEPENNLEMMSCSLLAKEIFQYNMSGIAQTFLTTHSPIFYNVSKENTDLSAIHYIYKDESQEKTLYSAKIDSNSLDTKMGVTPIYAEKIKDAQDELEKLRIAATENKQLFQNLADKETRSRVFVEGESDKEVLTKAFQVFKPTLLSRISIETKPDGAGHLYVLDMLAHWRARHKHHPSEPKAVGIVDDDASSGKNNWNAEQGNTASAKCFLLPKPQAYINADRTVFKFQLCLETLYPNDVWCHAKTNGWLQPLDKQEYLQPAVIEGILEQTKSLSDFVSEDTPLFLTNKFKLGKKITAAKYVARKEENYFRDNFSCLDTFLNDLTTYLGLEP